MCACGTASAQVKWTFGGFSTLAAVHSTERQADYTASPVAPGQAGYGKDWAFDVDSRAGAQLNAQFDKHWSAVVQVVEEKGVAHAYEPHLEWANVKYQVTPELSVRLGRIALPLFLAADYRKATYALPWLRTPVELYSLLPISTNDGIDAAYRWNAWGARQETQITFGGGTLHLTPEIRGKSRNAFAITHTATAGALTMKATASATTIEIDGTEAFFSALRSFGPPGDALADRYDIASRRVTMLSAGFSYDPGKYFLMGEIGRINTRSLLGDQTAGYLSAGYRFGALAPYVTVASVDANMPTETRGLPIADLAPEAAGLAASLNGALNTQLHAIGIQEAVSIGVRWDIVTNYAFKAQLDRVRPRRGSIGTLIDVQPGFRSGQAFGVVSAGIDVVF